MSDDDGFSFPPRRRDWKKGTHQLGIFIRTPEGTIVRFVADEAKLAAVEVALAVIRHEDPMKELAWVQQQRDELAAVRERARKLEDERNALGAQCHDLQKLLDDCRRFMYAALDEHGELELHEVEECYETECACPRAVEFNRLMHGWKP